MVDSEHTFLFADLAGFTALTEAHGDAHAADLADEFCGSVKALLPDEGAEAVKTIGDAVMVRLSGAGDAVRLAVRVTNEIGAQHGVPSVRVGMHTGPAVERAGDWFGATVNTAARVSGLARGGEVLVTEATFRAVGDLDDIELREHGRHELKNVAEPVSVYRVQAVGSARRDDLRIDPVCRMAVDPSHSAGSLTHEGVEYHFCSMDCVRAFTAAPHLHAPGHDDAGAVWAGPVPLVPGGVAAVRRALALTQGASYLYFGLWSLLRRKHYRSVHELKGDDWVLNAHGGWLSVVGATLVAGSLRRGQSSSELTTLGLGSALALAANDAVLMREIAGIYRLDLAYETTIVALWALAARPSGAS